MLFVYEPGDSFMHRMDSVTKLVWLLIITIAVVIGVRAIENLTIFLWLLVVAFLFARLRFLTFLKRLLPLTIVAIWLLVILAVLYPRGEAVLVTIGPVQLTYEGLDYGIALFFRVMCLGTASIIFTLTTNPRRLINELIEIAGLSYRWAYSLYSALRFVPMLQTEARNVMNAHAVRGAAEKRRSIFNVITPIRRLTIPLLVGGLRRVQITAIAMDSRAFGAYPKRTNIDPIEAPLSGRVFTALHLAGLIAFIIWRIVWGGGGLLISPIVT